MLIAVKCGLFRRLALHIHQIERFFDLMRGVSSVRPSRFPFTYLFEGGLGGYSERNSSRWWYMSRNGSINMHESSQQQQYYYVSCCLLA
jgi:hypothetical protein